MGHSAVYCSTRAWVPESRKPSDGRHATQRRRICHRMVCQCRKSVRVRSGNLFSDRGIGELRASFPSRVWQCYHGDFVILRERRMAGQSRFVPSNPNTPLLVAALQRPCAQLDPIVRHILEWRRQPKRVREKRARVIVATFQSLQILSRRVPDQALRLGVVPCLNPCPIARAK